MNQIVLTGNITKELEIKKVADVDVLKFSIAVKRDKEKVDFIPIVVFGKQAELTAKYCTKGSKVLVKWALHINAYTDQNNVKKYSTEIVANNYEGIEFLSTKKVEIDENCFVD